jgi:hypothetical protein
MDANENQDRCVLIREGWVVPDSFSDNGYLISYTAASPIPHKKPDRLLFWQVDGYWSNRGTSGAARRLERVVVWNRGTKYADEQLMVAEPEPIMNLLGSLAEIWYAWLMENGTRDGNFEAWQMMDAVADRWGEKIPLNVLKSNHRHPYGSNPHFRTSLYDELYDKAASFIRKLKTNHWQSGKN